MTPCRATPGRIVSTASGRAAEDAAAEYLKHKGYKIIMQNWRTRWCEIDIVAERKKVVYFVEVKYRRNDTQGSGLEYITQRKLTQMQFAAESWVHEQGWKGDYRLSAIEVSGQNFAVTAHLEDVNS